jgi:hypothetical protein
MKNVKQYLMLSLAAAMFIGCAQKRTLTVGSDQKQDIDMSKFRTYDWVSTEGEMWSSQYDTDSQDFQNQNEQTERNDQNQQHSEIEQNQQTTLEQNQQNTQMNQNQQDTQFGQQNHKSYNKSSKKSIKQAIETQLLAKGFAQESNNPDLLVSYMVLNSPTQLRTFRRGSYSYLGVGPAGGDVEMVDVEEGTILVNFTDAETGSQVWQGYASGALEEADLKDEQTVQAKIAAIFQQFDFSGFSLSNVQGGNR